MQLQICKSEFLPRCAKRPGPRRARLFGASGDTELFEKASNINGFQGGRVANNLYISPFRATVFKTAALFLYPNSSVVIRVEKLLFLSLGLAFRTGHGCFPIWVAAEAYRRTNRPKSTLFIFRGRRCEDGCIHDIYGVEVSGTTVSRITDKILPVAKEWQQRPLESIYAVVFLDTIHFHRPG